MMNRDENILYPKISVIVAVYQSETYLLRCVNSLLNQIYNDYEIILVDDGSTDRSGTVCDELQAKNENIHVIHKDHEGVAVARQMGLDAAHGEYVIFTDSDDWVEPDYLSVLSREAVEKKADMVICDFFSEYGDKTVYKNQKPSALTSEAVLNDLFSGKLMGSTWNKLVRTDCYRAVQDVFPAGLQYCEDKYAISAMLLKGICITYVNKALYHYDRRTNPSALTRQYTIESFENDMVFYWKLLELFSGYVEPEMLRPITIRGIAERAFIGHIFSSKEYKNSFFPYRFQLLKASERLVHYMYYCSALGLYEINYRIFRSLNIIRGHK